MLGVRTSRSYSLDRVLESDLAEGLRGKTFKRSSEYSRGQPNSTILIAAELIFSWKNQPQILVRRALNQPKTQSNFFCLYL